MASEPSLAPSDTIRDQPHASVNASKSAVLPRILGDYRLYDIEVNVGDR